MIKHNLRVCVK